MSMPGAAAFTEAYEGVDASVSSTVDTNLETRTETIARYFGADLALMVNEGHIELARWLNVPPTDTFDDDVLIGMMCHDVQLMLKKGLIRGVHILLSDPIPDPNSDPPTYKLRYHARYLIEMPRLPSYDQNATGTERNGRVEVPRVAYSNARFVFGIEWSDEASEERRAQVRTPTFLFDWVPESGSFDGSSLVEYRYGGMSINGVEVQRVEFGAPWALGR